MDKTWRTLFKLVRIGANLSKIYQICLIASSLSTLVQICLDWLKLVEMYLTLVNIGSIMSKLAEPCPNWFKLLHPSEYGDLCLNLNPIGPNVCFICLRPKGGSCRTPLFYYHSYNFNHQSYKWIHGLMVRFPFVT